MKSLLAASAALALIAVAAPAAAETYVNLGYTGVEPDQSSLGAVTGRVGWRQGYFGVEAEASKGVRDDSVTSSGVTADVELDYQYAGYVTGRSQYPRTSISSDASATARRSWKSAQPASAPLTRSTASTMASAPSTTSA